MPSSECVMDDKLEVTVTGELQDENLKKFQKLLAYFVEHLELCELYNSQCMSAKSNNKKELTKEQKSKIWESISRISENASIGKHNAITGQGYNGDRIQDNIKEWELLKDGKICISVQYAQKGDPYFSETTYLHWAGFAGNVSIYVKAENKHITSLYIKDKWNRKDKKDKSDTQDNKETQDEGALIYSKKKAKYQLADLGISVSVDGKEVKIDNSNAGSSIETNLENFYNAFVEAKRLETAQRLRIAKNIIFTGAPGTGKTYLAKEIADLIDAQTEFVQFHPSYDYTDFVEGLRPVKDSNDKKSIVFERKDGIFKAFCERALKQWLLDQNQGISTLKSNNTTNVNLDAVCEKISKVLNDIKLEDMPEDGATTTNNNTQPIIKERIKNLIEEIKEREKRKEKKEEQKEEKQITSPFVFIIDEINRGEISKIFGELFFSVDPGYRGVDGAVKTQYANLQTTPNLFDLVLMALGKANEGDYGHFFIPENVYIIGTMNDIDRSVESMDFAFRRRFTFIEIKAKDTQKQILNTLKISDIAKKKKAIDTLVEKMDELNKTIYDPDNKSTDNQYDLSEAYHIGAAYFKHYEDYCGQDNDYGKLWDNHLKGVLYEYLRGKPNAEETMKTWKNAYANGILSIVGIRAKELRQNLSNAENPDDIVKKIKDCILANIEKTKSQLQEEILAQQTLKDYMDAIKSSWASKNKNKENPSNEDNQ